MSQRQKIHILDNPHRDLLSANPESCVQPVIPQILEPDETVIELDSINILESEEIQPELTTS